MVLDEVVHTLERELSQKPNLSHWDALAIQYSIKGDYGLLITTCEEALKKSELGYVGFLCLVSNCAISLKQKNLQTSGRFLKTIVEVMERGIYFPNIFEYSSVFSLMLGKKQEAKRSIYSSIERGESSSAMFEIYADVCRGNLTGEDLSLLEKGIELGQAKPLVFHVVAGHYVEIEDNDSAIRVLEKGLEDAGYDEITVLNLASCLFRKGNFEPARVILEESIREGYAHPGLVNSLAIVYGVLEKPELEEEILRKAIDFGRYNSATAYMLYEYTGDKSLIDLIRKRAETGEDPDSLVYLASYETRERPNEKVWRENLARYVSQIGISNSLRLGQKDPCISTAEVLIPSSHDSIMSVVILKKGKKPFDREISIGDDLRQLSGVKVEVPTPLACFEKGGFWYYAMERETSGTLSQLILSANLSPEVYSDVCLTIARIHALMSIDDLEPYPIQSKLEQRISGFNELLGSNGAALDIGLFQPVLGGVEKGVMVFNNDSAPNNWMFSHTGEIIKIDTEDKGYVPASLDLALFLNTFEFLPFTSRFFEVNKYVLEFNRVRGSKITTGSELGSGFISEYLNAVIYRAVTSGVYQLARGNERVAKKIFHSGVDAVNFLERNRMVSGNESKTYGIISKNLSLAAA